jgi:hypothetical protein
MDALIEEIQDIHEKEKVDEEANFYKKTQLAIRRIDKDR